MPSQRSHTSVKVLSPQYVKLTKNTEQHKAQGNCVPKYNIYKSSEKSTVMAHTYLIHPMCIQFWLFLAMRTLDNF